MLTPEDWKFSRFPVRGYSQSSLEPLSSSPVWEESCCSYIPPARGLQVGPQETAIGRLGHLFFPRKIASPHPPKGKVR